MPRPDSVLFAVVLEDFVLAVTVSGQKVFVVKRQHAHPEHVTA